MVIGLLIGPSLLQKIAINKDSIKQKRLYNSLLTASIKAVVISLSFLKLVTTVYCIYLVIIVSTNRQKGQLLYSLITKFTLY